MRFTINKEQKIMIASEILDRLKKSVIEKIDDMPVDWNGVEIRKFISDFYAANYLGHCDLILKQDHKRYKEYKNDILVLDLI